MFDLRKLISNLIRVVGSILLFLFLVVFISGLLGQKFGYDIDFLTGDILIKNIHLVIAIISSIIIVTILNITRSKFLENLHPSNKHINSGRRRQKTDNEYGFVDDFDSSFVDDILNDVIDDRYLDFIDEIPRKETFNKSGSLAKRKQKKINHRSEIQVIAETFMTYHGGGLYRGSRPLKIKVTHEGLHYGLYFIPNNNIKSFHIDNKAQMSVKREKTASMLQLFLFGPLSLILNSAGSENVNIEGLILNIDYLENGENHTLVLEGPSATEVQKALVKMQSQFT